MKFRDLLSTTPNSNQGHSTFEGASEGSDNIFGNLFGAAKDVSQIYRNITGSDPEQANARAAAPPVVTRANESLNTKTMMMIGAAVLALVLILSLTRK